jgi:hypothetical protein
MARNEKIKLRQSKLKKLFLEQLKRTPTIEQSCHKAGITRMTVSRWRKASKRFDVEVEESIREGHALISDIAESHMFSHINQGKSDMIKFYLTHSNPRYSNKIEIKGHITNLIGKLSPELDKLLKHGLQFAAPQQSYEPIKEEQRPDADTEDDEDEPGF